MKIILLAKSIDGGTGTFFISLLKLINKKIQVIPCILEKPSYRYVEGDRNLIQTFSKGNYPEIYHFNIQNILLILNELTWIRKIIDNTKPDAIISIDLHSILLIEICRIISRNRYRHIGTIHNNIRSVLQNKASLGLKWGILAFSKVMIKKVDVLVAVSSSLANDIKDFFKLKKYPLVIYYGIPISVRTKIRKRNSGKIILSIARLSEQKDHKTLIDAFYTLQKNCPLLELWLVGDGPLNTTILSQVKRLKIETKVKLLGWVQNPIKLLHQADIFVLATKREGFPYVLLEALQAGIPIISSDCPFGPKEILDNGKYGILVPVGDRKGLTNAIADLLKSKKKRQLFSKLSLERSKVFSEKIMLNKYLDIFQNKGSYVK